MPGHHRPFSTLYDMHLLGMGCTVGVQNRLVGQPDSVDDECIALVVPDPLAIP